MKLFVPAKSTDNTVVCLIWAVDIPSEGLAVICLLANFSLFMQNNYSIKYTRGSSYAWVKTCKTINYKLNRDDSTRIVRDIVLFTCKNLLVPFEWPRSSLQFGWKSW